MGCRPVRGDNPRALASGLYYVQADKHDIIFYTTYISVDLAHHGIYRAKLDEGGIKITTLTSTTYFPCPLRRTKTLEVSSCVHTCSSIHTWVV